MATGNAAANAKNNTTTGTENSKVEGTIVLSDLEKKAITDEATLLFSKVQIGQRATLKDKLELAKFLLKMKRELKNEFYKVITDDIISRKQVGRHIQLILTLKSVDKYTQGMSTKDKKSEME